MRLEEAIAIDPTCVPAHQLLGQAYLKQKEYDKALALWKKLLETQPDSKMARQWIAHVERVKKDDEHLAELARTIEKRPKDADARLERARLLAARREWQNVLADLEPVLAAKPDSYDALTLAGNACYGLGRFGEAVAHLQRAVAASKDSMEATLWLKKAQEMNKTQTRLRDVEARLVKSPADGDLYLESGRLWYRLGQMRNAMARLAKAAQLSPRNAAAQREYALLLLRIGRMDEALKLLETCVKLEPGNKENAKLLEAAKKTRDMHAKMRKGASGVPAHGASKAGDSQK